MGTLIEKTTYDLGLVVAANMATCGLSIETQEYYLQNKNLIPEAIRCGFVLPVPEVQSTTFKTADTDLCVWLAKAEEFYKKFFGLEIGFSRMFDIPQEIPWPSAIPVFDPGGITNKQAVEKALKSQGLKVWEQVDVMGYGGSEANKKPSLHLIQNSLSPDKDTMNQTPDELLATGKSWLSQRGYILGFGIHHCVTGEYLDPETWTWFPNNRLSAGQVAGGYWSPHRREVGLSWTRSDRRYGDMGSRLAILVPLRS